MEYRKFPQGYVVRLDPGDEVTDCLTRLAGQEQIALASISGLGAANDVTLGIFDTGNKEYHAKRCQGDYEISSLVGNVTLKNGAPYLHLHITIGDPVAGTVHAGHLTACTISATAELFVTVWQGQVDRTFHDGIGLNLLAFT